MAKPVLPNPPAGRYPVWLCDIWGVVHDGVTAFEAAVDALMRYRSEGGMVALISNSPRPAGAVAEQLKQVGVPDGTYDVVVTSGDVTRNLIVEQMGEIFFHLGPERDAPVYAGLEIDLAEFDDATIILCTGLLDDETETPDDYGDLLMAAAERGMTMICANPDIVVQRGDKLIYCAGALAEAYVSLEGTCIMAGKPHEPIYRLALAQLEEFLGREPAAGEMLVIGDGVPTDLKGAAQQGLDCLFITGGVNQDDGASNSDRRNRLVREAQDKLPGLKLIGTQNALAW
jgi:HAD superfamily hydrolase (TIGR01459 family)